MPQIKLVCVSHNAAIDPRLCCCRVWTRLNKGLQRITRYKAFAVIYHEFSFLQREGMGWNRRWNTRVTCTQKRENPYVITNGLRFFCRCPECELPLKASFLSQTRLRKHARLRVHNWLPSRVACDNVPNNNASCNRFREGGQTGAISLKSQVHTFNQKWQVLLCKKTNTKPWIHTFIFHDVVDNLSNRVIVVTEGVIELWKNKHTRIETSVLLSTELKGRPLQKHDTCWKKVSLTQLCQALRSKQLLQISTV